MPLQVRLFPAESFVATDVRFSDPYFTLSQFAAATDAVVEIGSPVFVESPGFTPYLGRPGEDG
jgi:hypothetical protein